MKDSNNAQIIKAVLLDYILAKFKSPLIGSEILFGSKRRSADLISLSKFLIAYEIKSSSDDLRKLESQLQDYSSVFDYTIIVTTDKHMKYLNNAIFNSYGIFIYKNEKIMQLHPPKLSNTINILQLLNSIPTSYLRSYFSILGSTSADKVRLSLMNNDLQSIKKCYKSYLIKKLEYGNTIFQQEKGISTHFEDLRLLSFSKENVIAN